MFQLTTAYNKLVALCRVVNFDDVVRRVQPPDILDAITTVFLVTTNRTIQSL